MSDETAQPFCGEELLPHATYPDGSPAPILCTREPHGVSRWHGNDECGTFWPDRGAAENAL